jgi:hypothetical protein
MSWTNLGYFMGSVVGWTGDLTNLIANAVATFGAHLTNSAGQPTQMVPLANGIFATSSDPSGTGLIYWIKDDFIYLVNNLGTPEMAGRLANFIGALIIGSGATAPANYPWF